MESAEYIIRKIKSRYAELFHEYTSTLWAYEYSKPDHAVHEYLEGVLQSIQDRLIELASLIAYAEGFDPYVLQRNVYLAALREQYPSIRSYRILYACYDSVYDIPDGEYGERLKTLFEETGVRDNDE